MNCPPKRLCCRLAPTWKHRRLGGYFLSLTFATLALTTLRSRQSRDLDIINYTMPIVLTHFGSPCPLHNFLAKNCLKYVDTKGIHHLCHAYQSLWFYGTFIEPSAILGQFACLVFAGKKPC